jgi:hypothetical protein
MARIAEVLRVLDHVRLPNERAYRTRLLAGVHLLPAFERRLQSRTNGEDLESTWALIVTSLQEHGPAAAADAALTSEETPLVTAESSQAALLFGSVSPTVTEADVHKLTNVLLSRFSPEVLESAELQKLTRSGQMHLQRRYSCPLNLCGKHWLTCPTRLLTWTGCLHSPAD